MCLTNVILAPGASEVGLGAAATCATLAGYCAVAAEFREVAFYVQASPTLPILLERKSSLDPKSPQES